MSALKAATAAHHERLERRVDIAARVRSRAAYRDLLERFYGFYAPLETSLEPYAQPVLDFSARRKLPLLAADVAALGGDPGALPRAARIPRVASVPDALGVLYVLEGATLGGKVIARLAGRSLGLTREHGAAFFGAYGPEVGARWKAFGAVAERHAAAPEAAVACFEALEEWL
jgi:heme oxygenase